MHTPYMTPPNPPAHSTPYDLAHMYLLLCLCPLPTHLLTATRPLPTRPHSLLDRSQLTRTSAKSPSKPFLRTHPHTCSPVTAHAHPPPQLQPLACVHTVTHRHMQPREVGQMGVRRLQGYNRLLQLRNKVPRTLNLGSQRPSQQIRIFLLNSPWSN